MKTKVEKKQITRIGKAEVIHVIFIELLKNISKNIGARVVAILMMFIFTIKTEIEGTTKLKILNYYAEVVIRKSILLAYIFMENHQGIKGMIQEMNLSVLNV